MNDIDKVPQQLVEKWAAKQPPASASYLRINRWKLAAEVVQLRKEQREQAAEDIDHAITARDDYRA